MLFIFTRVKLFDNSKRTSSLPLSSSQSLSEGNKNSGAVAMSGRNKSCLESSLSHIGLSSFEDNRATESENECHINKNDSGSIFIIGLIYYHLVLFFCLLPTLAYTILL